MGKSDSDNPSSNTNTTRRIRAQDTATSAKAVKTPQLIMVSGPSKLIGHAWEIRKKSTTVGRAPTSDIHVSDPSMSKTHARITIADGVVSISDLEATNGTAINGKKIQALQAIQLRNGDQISFGAVIFKFIEATH